MSQYRITVSHVDGGKVHLKPGGHGERDLVEAITERMVDELIAQVLPSIEEQALEDIRGAGVGWFVSEGAVLDVVKRALGKAVKEKLTDDKFKRAITKALDQVLWSLKAEVKPE